jgi:hypothetical protein
LRNTHTRRARLTPVGLRHARRRPRVDRTACPGAAVRVATARNGLAVSRGRAVGTCSKAVEPEWAVGRHRARPRVGFARRECRAGERDAGDHPWAGETSSHDMPPIRGG